MEKKPHGKQWEKAYMEYYLTYELKKSTKMMVKCIHNPNKPQQKHTFKYAHAFSVHKALDLILERIAFRVRRYVYIHRIYVDAFDRT